MNTLISLNMILAIIWNGLKYPEIEILDFGKFKGLGFIRIANADKYYQRDTGMYKKIIIKSNIDINMGSLSFFESDIDIPFSIKRIYYIYDVPKDTVRGHHAHKKLKQLLFCPYGEINIILDDGINRKEILLNKPSMGLIVGEGIWRTMQFITSNSILCIAASDYYDENDYVRDYKMFIQLVEEGYWK